MILKFKVIHRDEVLFELDNKQSKTEDFFQRLVVKRIRKLADITLSTTDYEEDTLVFTLNPKWGDVHGKFFKLLLINVVDFKRINFEDGESLVILNEDVNFDISNAVALYDSQGTHLDNLDYIKHNGFCLLADSPEALNPNVYSLDEDGNLFRLYIVDNEGTSMNALVPVVDISINQHDNDLKPTEYIMDILTGVTGNNYYPLDLENGYKTIIEMFY